ncbi:MAG: AraC family transcriptional regulator ligand-binding domain-containing protein [Pseudomonadales bacterium]
MTNQTVPVAFIQAMLIPLEHQGVDIAEFLLTNNIDLSPESVGVGAVGDITADQYNQVVLAALELMQDESGGIMGGTRTPFGTSRMLIYAVLNCHTLAEAMQRAIEFNFACMEAGSTDVTLRLEKTAGQRLVKLVYARENRSDGKAVRQDVMLCNLAIWLRICGWLIGRQIELVEAECAGEEPEETAVLRHFIKCPVSYNHDQNAVLFSSAYLDAPLVRDDAALEQFLRSAPYQVIVGGNLGAESIVSRIRRQLQNFTGETWPPFESLSQKLNMSVRTLRRRLDEEGVSYQQVKDDIRRDNACRLLLGTDQSIADIADQVGFSDASAFHRSFRKWTGQAPGEYRQQNKV